MAIVASRRIPQLPPEPVAKMTGNKTALLLSLALLFDAIKFMCTQLWFFGPALIALAGSTVLGGGWFGAAVGTVIGSAAALSVGAAIEAIGIILALAVGLMGWAIILALMFGWSIKPFHARHFGTIIIGMLVSEVPFIDAMPSFTITVWRVVASERKAEKEAHAKWEQENAALIRQVRERQLAEQRQALAFRAAEEEQAAQEEADAAQAEADAAAEQAVREIDPIEVASYDRPMRAPLLGAPSIIPEPARE